MTVSRNGNVVKGMVVKGITRTNLDRTFCFLVQDKCSVSNIRRTRYPKVLWIVLVGHNGLSDAFDALGFVPPIDQIREQHELLLLLWFLWLSILLFHGRIGICCGLWSVVCVVGIGIGQSNIVVQRCFSKQDVVLPLLFVCSGLLYYPRYPQINFN